MKILFKSTNSSVGGSNFKNHYPFASNEAPFLDVQEGSRQATISHILPFVGQAQYELIADAWHADNAIYKDIIGTLQDAIAYYTVYRMLPFKPYIIGQGVQKAKAGDNESLQLSDNKYMRWNAHIFADQKLDEVLKMMSESTDTFFDAYKEFAKEQTMLFVSAVDYQHFINIDSSRRTFVALLPSIRIAEEDTAQLVGNVLMQNAEGELKRLMKAYSAYRALEIAIPMLTLIIESTGFKVVSSGDGIEERNGLKAKEHAEAIANLRQATSEMAMSYKKKLLFYLWANESVLTDWHTSQYYIDAQNVPLRSPVTVVGGHAFIGY